MLQLKELGLSLSIDDFGTAYSSLGAQGLPIDRIKIDMQFVKGIESGDKDRAIAQVIINLAKSLHLKGCRRSGDRVSAGLSGSKNVRRGAGFYYYKPVRRASLNRSSRAAGSA